MRVVCVRQSLTACARRERERCHDAETLSLGRSWHAYAAEGASRLSEADCASLWGEASRRRLGVQE